MTRDDVGLDEVVEDDVVLVSLNGDVLEGADGATSESAVALAIMSSRSDVDAVVHAHSLHAVAFASTSRPLHALSHEGCHLVPPDVVRLHSTNPLECSQVEAIDVASALGARNAVLWSGHGLVTAAGTLGESVALAVYLEKACQLQLMVGDGGHTVGDDVVMQKRAGQLSRPRISWEYLQRVTSSM